MSERMMTVSPLMRSHLFEAEERAAADADARNAEMQAWLDALPF